MTRPLRSAVLALALLWGNSASAADAAHPEVVELFQSQGCSSCPPANANVMALAGRPDILALTFEVTYWDQLGWKDTFDQPVFTARQWDYAHGLKHENVFTPQVVVNGRRDGVGTDPAALGSLIAGADRGAAGPLLVVRPAHASIGAGVAPAGGADVWLVRYDPRIVNVPVQRGENAGRTLPHRDLVRQLVRLGQWTGRPAAFALPPAPAPGLTDALLVQVGRGGPILAAARD